MPEVMQNSLLLDPSHPATEAEIRVALDTVLEVLPPERHVPFLERLAAQWEAEPAPLADEDCGSSDHGV